MSSLKSQPAIKSKENFLGSASAWQDYYLKQQTGRDARSFQQKNTFSLEKPKRHIYKLWVTLSLIGTALVMASWSATPHLWSPDFSLPLDYVQLAALNIAGLHPSKGASPVSINVTDQVQWDQFSLIVKGQRIFLHSGEFHTFRLPVPSLWPDILQKVKAAGLNGISVYTHWGLINPSPGAVDFDGFRALQPLYDAAKAAGIWIVLRPGPYINAETSAGGIAHWATSQVAGTLRTNVSDFHAAWTPYIQGIIDETVNNQITHGGPVIAIQIDNEYSENGEGRREYFQQLQNFYRAGGIVVPLTYNDPGQEKNFVNGTGSVDIYGLDSYPQGFDCSHPQKWKGVTKNYHDYHMGTNPSQPFYIPEFQGGSFDAWGPTAPGYAACEVLTGPSFEDVFYKALWAANAKLINYYMIYGGTSWGAIPFHGVYTSYDYGSAISENRVINDKYRGLKRQGIFIRSSPEFYKTNWVGNSTSQAVNVSNPAAFVIYLANPDTNAGFYVARQTNSTSTAALDFKLDIQTSAGTLTVPQTVPSITLGGRQSKVIVTDYAFGKSRALYSTAEVFFAGQIGGRDVLFLTGDLVQQHEAALTLTGTPNLKMSNSNVVFNSTAAGQTIISFLAGIEGLITVWDSDTQLVLFGDTGTTNTFFAPVLPSTAHSGDAATFRNYWQFGSNESVLIGGPYLVRSASLSGSTLDLHGDLNSSVALTVIAPNTVRTIRWNGELVSLGKSSCLSVTHRGIFVGQVQAAKSLAVLKTPALSGWRFADSLPEVQVNFSDSEWAVANHTTTNIPFKPYYGDGRILYGCDYGFCENIVLWRGHFNATGQEKSMNLSINGGEAFAASVWINDVFLKTSFGNSTNNHNIREETDDQFIFPPAVLKVGEDNVVTVVQDNMGLNETQSSTNTPKGPRGIRGFNLSNGTFGDWKVQGKLGGYTGFPDKVRGIFNEGGLFGERQGWHLPGFDTSSWVHRDLSAGLPNSAAGVGFFVTTFELNVPEGTDVPMSFTFDNSAQPYRALLFVNGWMMGKRVANLGPQFKFPVHEGILDYRGKNTVAVALWVMEDNTPVTPSLQLTVDGMFDGGVGGVKTNNPVWTRRMG